MKIVSMIALFVVSSLMFTAGTYHAYGEIEYESEEMEVDYKLVLTPHMGWADDNGVRHIEGWNYVQIEIDGIIDDSVCKFNTYEVDQICDTIQIIQNEKIVSQNEELIEQNEAIIGLLKELVAQNKPVYIPSIDPQAEIKDFESSLEDWK